MTYYHATVLCDLAVGDKLIPASEAKKRSNFRLSTWVQPDDNLFDDGQRREDHEVVWICTDRDEADHWADHSMQKWTGEDVRAEVRARGELLRIVYEVEPVGPVFRRLSPHSPTEYGCNEAVITARHVVHEYDWREWYERDADGNAIDPYTDTIIHLDSPEPE